MSLGDPTKLKDALVFVNNPPPSEATQINAWPFTIYVSAADTDEHCIDLYSQYSRSRPYQFPQGTWSHLLPQWRFEDLNGNPIDSIITTDTQITDVSGTVIGVTGIAQFYYVDDMPSYDYSSPLMIWATLEVSGRPVLYDIQGIELAGYANSKIIKGEPYYINGFPPTHLTITRNGIDDIANIKWVDKPFRYTTVIKSNWLSGMCGNVSGDCIVFDYPQEEANLFAATHEIHRDVRYVPASAQSWLPLSAYFLREDQETTLYVGGFQIGSIQSSDSVLNTQLSAWVGIQSWGSYRDTPYVWISNGEMQRLNRVGLLYSFGGVTYTNPLLPDIQTYSYDVSGGIGSYSVETSAVSGTPYWSGSALTVDIFGGIYGMAVGPCYDIWAVDSELDQMYHFSTNGTMLTSIDILPEGSSPQAIVLDSNLNKWVTLYGATSTVKFDIDGNLTGYVAVPPGLITDQFSVTGDPDSILIRPIQVETDSEDNIWVTYKHALSSMLLKYDSYGVFITSCNIPISAQPQGLVVDPWDNSVWVSDTYEILVDPYSWTYAASGGTIQHFSSAGAFISSFVDIPHPGYMSIDVNRNVWFTFGYSGIGVISGSDVLQYWLTGGTVVPYGAEEIAVDNSLLGFNDRIKGIAIDGRNRVWALNSRDSDAYVINADNISEYVVVSILPHNVDAIEFSIQGMGDWTGWHWLQKYYYPTATTLEYVISGVSNRFNINEFSNNFEIRKFNDSWDATQQIHDYALPENLYEYNNLFDVYLNAMVGGLSAEQESIGRKSYERIANFVQNHVDIDTCGIDQLYSLANELDVPMDDYTIDFPVNLKRLMEIISISHQRLWGARCKCNKKFSTKQTCTVCGHNHCLNRSTTVLDINTDILTGGNKIVVKPIFGLDTYDILTTPLTVTSGVCSVSVYPISAANSISWLTSANYDNYYFYRYIPTFCDIQVDGVINWEDSYTTLSENVSSLSEWYGKNELVDIMLNYNLHEGLQFNLE